MKLTVYGNMFCLFVKIYIEERKTMKRCYGQHVTIYNFLAAINRNIDNNLLTNFI